MADLPPALATELTGYLQQARPQEPAAARPDAFSYQLTWHPDGPDLRVPEHDLPDPVRQLISDALG